MILKTLSVFFLPIVILGQFVADDSDGFYRRLYDDGRESILVEHFLEEQPIEIGLEMVQNTCSGETEPFSCRMIIPAERRRIAYVWTKHTDFEKIGRFSGGTRDSFFISPFHRIFWRQVGLDPSGGIREDISLACGHFDWMRPAGGDSKEGVKIQAMAFQGELENRQLFNTALVPQYIFILGPTLAIPTIDGSYRLTEIEFLNTKGHIPPRSQDYYTGIFGMTEIMEFIFKTADSSICRTTFSIGDITGPIQDNITFQYAREILPAVVHREGESYHIKFRDGIIPVVVDREGDIHQKNYPHSFKGHSSYSRPF